MGEPKTRHSIAPNPKPEWATECLGLHRSIINLTVRKLIFHIKAENFIIYKNKENFWIVMKFRSR